MAADHDEDEVLEPSVIGVSPELSDRQRAERDSQIVGARLRGLSVETICRSFDVSPGLVKNAVGRYRRDHPSMLHREPLVIAEELIDGYQATIEELALISASAANDATRVGAINAKMHAYGKITELLQGLGVLPHDLGRLRIEMDAGKVADAVAKVIDEYELPDEVVEAFMAALAPPQPPVDMTVA